MRKLLAALALLAIAALLVVGLLSAGGEEGESSSAVSEQAATTALGDAPGALGELYAQANELVGGGPPAFRERLRSLRGRPVVVNKWASWCGPCRAEFPHFQRQALRRGREIAFVGVNSLDNADEARAFLERFPVPYPSYEDGDHEIAKLFRGTVAFPTTAFYDRRGELAYVRQGQYRTEADLARDIERYAR